MMIRLECDTTPVMPVNFVEDRQTWNAVCSANKELHQTGRSLTPPWPQTKIELGSKVGALKFSPCGSFLAYGTRSSPYLVHICDRRGRQTSLRGHTSGILCLSFSNDGNYLAYAGSRPHDASIRIWPTHPTSRLPQQSDKTLRGHEGYITCLDFSPGASNILASGDNTAIKLWNVEQEICIYSFDHTCGRIPSLYFSVEDEGHKCIFVTRSGSLIRTRWIEVDQSDIESDIVDMPGLGAVQSSAISHCRSLLTAVSPVGSTLTLYDIKAMTVVQRLTVPRSQSVR
jgi:WD40 repeat protein